MTSLPNLHDGFFDGLWLSGDKQVYLFVRTVEGERSTIHLTEAEALNISGLRAGNIIFDVVLIPPDKLTIEDIDGILKVIAEQLPLALADSHASMEDIYKSFRLVA